VHRIAAIRNAADKSGVALFINARTDIFFEHGDSPASVMDEAPERAKAYAAAGASGFFIPGLVNEKLIERICKEAPLPVNVMVMEGVPSNARLTKVGVSRISYGPIPYLDAMEFLRKKAKRIHA